MTLVMRVFGNEKTIKEKVNKIDVKYVLLVLSLNTFLYKHSTLLNFFAMHLIVNTIYP